MAPVLSASAWVMVARGVVRPRIPHQRGVMADTEKTAATLLDELVALGRAQRCEVANELRKVAETYTEVPDGRHTAHTLGLLACMLDSD